MNVVHAGPVGFSDAIGQTNASLVVSPLVDEVFYVLKKCTRRALVTSSLNAMGDVIMYAHTLLVTTYKEALEALLAASDRSQEMHLSGG